MPLFDQARLDLKAAASAASETVVIVPKSGRPFTAPARIGQKVFKTYNGDVQVNVVCRRFLVELSDLGQYAPKTGDRIQWHGRVYRMGNPDGGPPWHWHGNDNSAMAIYATEAIQMSGS